MTDLSNEVPLNEVEIKEYWGIVHATVAAYTAIKAIPNYLDKEDLCQELYTALLEALRSYKDNKNTKKTTWIRKICYFRLIDFLRSDSWVPRPTFYKLRDNEEFIPRQCSMSDLGKARDKDEEVNTLVDFISEKQEKTYNIDLIFEAEDLASFLFKVKRRGVGDRDGAILYKYFMLERKMKTIGGDYGLTESRISQIISSYIPMIRQMATKYVQETR